MKNILPQSARGLLSSLLCAVSVASAFVSSPTPSAVYGQNAEPPPPTAFTETRRESLLNSAFARTVEYRTKFKDLTAEEKQTIELYDTFGGLLRSRRIVSDFVVYQSQLDSSLVTEYRNVREVDSVPVAGRQERVVKLFERLSKANSVSKELERLDEEGSRYDLNYSVKGLTLNQGMALQPDVRSAFKFEVTGYEKINGHDMVVVAYTQVAQHPKLKFRFSLPAIPKSSEPKCRGRLWLDSTSAQIWREEREVTVQIPSVKEPLVLMRLEINYSPSQFQILVPERITFVTLGTVKLDNGKVASSSIGGRVTFEYNGFTRFEVRVRDENARR